MISFSFSLKLWESKTTTIKKKKKKKTLGVRCHPYPHFADVKTDTERQKVTRIRPHH